MTPQDFRAARIGLGLSRAELADILGVSIDAIRHWEAEHGNQTRKPHETACKVLVWMAGKGRPQEWPQMETTE